MCVRGWMSKEGGGAGWYDLCMHGTTLFSPAGWPKGTVCSGADKSGGGHGKGALWERVPLHIPGTSIHGMSE